jgi:hypothetical protein
MNSDAPRREKVLPQTADESLASPHSYYQFLLRKCRSQPGTSATAGKLDGATSDPKQR